MMGRPVPAGQILVCVIGESVVPAGDWIALAAIGVTLLAAGVRFAVRLGSLEQELKELRRRTGVLERRIDNVRARRYSK